MREVQQVLPVSPSSLLPVRAHNTDTTVATEAASTRMHCRRGCSLAGGTCDQEGGTKKTAPSGIIFLKTFKDLIPYYPRRSFSFYSAFNQSSCETIKIHSHCENELK